MNWAQKYFKFLVIIFFAPTLCFSYSSTSDVIGGIPLLQNVNASSYTPENINHIPEVLISRDLYLISLNPQTRLLNWAAWKLELSDIGHIGRANNFLPDPDLQNYLAPLGKQAISKDDYFGSCFDRGHQVPSADRDTTTELNQHTFLMSNMLPQTAYLNRVIWEHLEQHTRDLVVGQHKKVYIIAGPIYDEDFGKFGPNLDIPVPSKNFKIVIVLDENQTLSDINNQTQIISVIMPNLLKNGKKPMDDKTELCNESVSLNTKPPVIPGTPSIPSTPVAPSAPVAGHLVLPDNNDWQQYQVPLQQIERLTGFKILPTN